MEAYYYKPFLKILTPVSYLKYLTKIVGSVKVKTIDQPEKAPEKLVSPDIYRVLKGWVECVGLVDTTYHAGQQENYSYTS